MEVQTEVIFVVVESAWCNDQIGVWIDVKLLKFGEDVMCKTVSFFFFFCLDSGFNGQWVIWVSG